ncbi:hypothetical protein BO71DRAFT_399131 [Aspergillus ellipticus CBS 707.79]|uniref:Extracellular serine-rich protein n=1 Tax=Aspergillus ellipticus CBS 707.79 TaxID=1448320 RepID=A0A319DS17_9EURO|nr:hypothetical protein BO71DRAFT_399131 [Aspergillus ellipticus CBS 707.79]
MPFLSHLIALVALISAATAQYGDASTTAATSTSATTSTSTKTSTSTGKATHTIQVGVKTDPHQYEPHNLTAAVGDIIVFEFYPANHSVVKADYLAPCVPANEGLFYSGPFNSFNENNGQLIGPPPTWSLVVNDTEPTFFYCTALQSCIGNGMVGVINPNASMTWEAQYEKAKTYPYMLVPGQSTPAEGYEPSSNSSSSNTSNNNNNNNNNNSSSGLSGGAIAGIVVGSVAFVAILGALFFLLGRNRVYSQWMMSSQDGSGRRERTARWAALLGGSTAAGSTAGGPTGNETVGTVERKSEMEGTGVGNAGLHMQTAGSPGPGMEYAAGSPQPQQGQRGPWGYDGAGGYQQGQNQGHVLYEAMGSAPEPSELDASARV